MRWKNGPIPLSTKIHWSNKQLKAARKGIDTFMEEVINQKESIQKKTHLFRAFCTIEEMFTANRDKLLAPNVEIQTPKGKKVIKLERTNNGAEQDFRRIRRDGRKLRGGC